MRNCGKSATPFISIERTLIVTRKGPTLEFGLNVLTKALLVFAAIGLGFGKARLMSLTISIHQMTFPATKWL